MKRSFLVIGLLVGIGILGGAFASSPKVEAACGGNFPFGFMNGGGVGRQGKDVDLKDSVYGSTNGGTFDIGTASSLTFNVVKYRASGCGPTQPGGSAADILNWVTIDINDSIFSSATGGSAGMHGDNTAGDPQSCPGGGPLEGITPSDFPGYTTVYNDQDFHANSPFNNRAPDGTSGHNGVNQSPIAYNPSTNQGKEDCQSQGRMVWWQDSNVKFNDVKTHSFTLNLKPVYGKFCLTENVSIVYASDNNQHFPVGYSQENGGPTKYEDDNGQPNNSASHLVEQSNGSCYIHHGPSGTAPNLSVNAPKCSAGGSSINGWATVPGNSAETVDIAVYIDGPESGPGAGTLLDVTQTTGAYPVNNPNWSMNIPSGYSAGAHTFYVYATNQEGDETGPIPRTGGTLSGDPATFTPCAPPIVGIYSAVCSNDIIYGYAEDKLVTSNDLTVNIYEDNTQAAGGTFLGSTIAKAVWDGANPNWSFAIPNSVWDNSAHTFYAYAVTTNGTQSGPGIASSGAMTNDPINFNLSPCSSYKYNPSPVANLLGAGNEDPTGIKFTNTTGFSTADPVSGAATGPPPTCVSGVTITYSAYMIPQDGSPTIYYKNSVSDGPRCVANELDTYYKINNPPVSSMHAGDTYCLAVSMNPGSGFVISQTGQQVGPQGPAKAQTSPCQTITNRPFYKVYGNGALVGGSYDGTPDTMVGLGGWNDAHGLYPNYSFGAGSELANMSTGNIDGYGSGQQTFTNNNKSFRLAFANMDYYGDTSMYTPQSGGDYNDVSGITNSTFPLTDETPITYTTCDAWPCLSTTTPGDYEYQTDNNVNLNIGALDLKPGQNVVVSVLGDAYITGDITYSGSVGGVAGAWSIDPTTNSISVPSFILRATGNIYIKNTVGVITGFYEAKPDSTNHRGAIYTCAQQVGTAFQPWQKSTMYDNCKQQLTVYGTIEAKSVHLGRTYGTLRDETPTPPSYAPGSAGITAPLEWNSTGSGGYTSSDSCVILRETSEPNDTQYTGGANTHTDNSWQHAALCVPPGDSGNKGPVKLSFSCFNFQSLAGVSNPFGCDSYSSSPGGMPYCTTNGANPAASMGAQIQQPPWSYTVSYAWVDNELCSNYQIAFVTSDVNPISLPAASQKYYPDGVTPIANSASTSPIPNSTCTNIVNPTDQDGSKDVAGNWVWTNSTGTKSASWVCIITSKIDVQTGTPSRPTTLTCSNNALTPSSPRPTCAAEVFDFSPEFYLSSPPISGGADNASKSVDIYSLPPIL